MIQKMDVIAKNGVPFRVIYDQSSRIVAFYDRRHNFTPDGRFNGQFTGASYFYGTMMEHPSGCGLNLHGGVEDWSLDGSTFNLVCLWLKSFDCPVD